MSVQSVSKDEILSARKDMPAVPSTSKKTLSKSKSKPQELYVDKISDKKIAEFFAPYGYFTHFRDKSNNSIIVICNDCSIIFDDFTLLAEAANNCGNSGDTDFNFSKFEELCEQMNITPSRAISDRLEEEVLNKLPYYVERKNLFTEKNLDSVKEEDTYAPLLSHSIKKEKHRESYAKLNKTYGSINPIEIADTLARLNPNH